MMGFRTLAFTYVFGGLTFLPLLLAAVLALIWYTSPKVQDEKAEHGSEATAHQTQAEEEQQARSRQESVGDAGASGTFAVLRKYDFSAAIGALNARNNNGANSNIGHDGGLVADGSSGGAGESVYQSMYRSVFSGNKNASSTSLLSHDGTEQSTGYRRKQVPVNVLFIVLRHGHLMVYDSPAQVEVKHVISLAHHKVTLQAGNEGEDGFEQSTIMEADLFTKRTAIVLTPVELPNGSMQQSHAHHTPKPFYLFCATNIDKEDFYHALLAARRTPPVPRQLEAEALVKLQSSLHSSSLTPETRALNALLGRVFLGIHRTDVLVNFVRSKIEKKLRRIQKPSFIPLLEIRSIDLGDAGPTLSNLKLRDLNISGDTVVSADMRYNGGLSLTLLAVAKLDLGPRFKARTIELVLKTSLKRISGTMLLRVKPSPTNRLWFCFENKPEMDIRVEPVVSERKITYGFVLRAIEERVRTAIVEGLVQPNRDDVPMPLQDTRSSHARGGLWVDEGDEDHVQPRQDAGLIRKDRDEKTMSMPDLAQEVDTAASTGLSSNSEINVSRLRHSSTMPVEPGQVKRRPHTDLNDTTLASETSPRPPKALRSPSITSMSPSVAVDEKSIQRANDASLRAATLAQNKSMWRKRANAPPQQTQRDAMEELRDLREKAEKAITKPSAVAMNDAEKTRRTSDAPDEEADDSIRPRLESEDSQSTIPATPRSFSTQSMDSDYSTAATQSSSRSLPRSQQLQQKKTNILAAAGAATNAARTWGWNTIQKNRAVLPRQGTNQQPTAQTSNQPMGRGQPLPPPGQPLPGPQKGIWGAMGGMRRKPVPAGAPPLPTRKAKTQPGGPDPPANGEQLEQEVDAGDSQSATTGGMGEDEFGTWQENPGENGAQRSEDFSGNLDVEPDVFADGDESDDHQDMQNDEEDLLDLTADDDHDTVKTSKKSPPPLPVRRRQHQEDPPEQQAPLSTDEHEVEAQNHTVENDDSDATPLKVPEDQADFIAAENSTEMQAYGLADDETHIDKSAAVEHDDNGDALHPSTHDDAESNTLTRTATQERFLRGEDVGEEDFEHHDVHESTLEAASTEQASMAEEQSSVSERIRAQVEKHDNASEADKKGWHAGPKGTAVN